MLSWLKFVADTDGVESNQTELMVYLITWKALSGC